VPRTTNGFSVELQPATYKTTVPAGDGRPCVFMNASDLESDARPNKRSHYDQVSTSSANGRELRPVSMSVSVPELLKAPPSRPELRCTYPRPQHGRLLSTPLSA